MKKHELRNVTKHEVKIVTQKIIQLLSKTKNVKPYWLELTPQREGGMIERQIEKERERGGGEGGYKLT